MMFFLSICKVFVIVYFKKKKGRRGVSSWRLLKLNDKVDPGTFSFSPLGFV